MAQQELMHTEAGSLWLIDSSQDCPPWLLPEQCWEGSSRCTAECEDLPIL